MRRRFRLPAACSFFVIVVAAAAAQERSSIPAGDASLAGRVIDVDAERPLENAIVTLTSLDRKSALKTLSDANGRYVFEHIAWGSYYVSAFLDGYGTYDYGSRDGRDGRTEAVGVPQARATTGVDFLIRRAGAITGRVIRTGGQPIKDATVMALLMLEDRGVIVSSKTQSITNSEGFYTIPNVPAGSYRVSAMSFDREAMKAGARTGISATYFPGTAWPAEAAAVRVGVGETVRNINIPVSVTELFRISGHVLRGSAEGSIESVLLASGWSVRTIRIAEDGAFDITHLEPGRYTLWARGRTVDGHEAAVITLDVASDMTGLTLPLFPTGGVSGRVVTGDGTPVPDRLQVAAVQADEGKRIDLLERDRVDATEGGRFELRGLFGERILRVLGLGPEWDVDRVLRGKSIVQSLSIASGEQTDGITIVLKRR